MAKQSTTNNKLTPTQIVSKVDKQIDNLPIDQEGYEKLTYKQRVFVNSYLQHYNGKKAAIQAGFSKISAHTEASRLLKSEHIRQAILRREQALAKASVVTKEWVLLELVEFLEELKANPRSNPNLQLKTLEAVARVAGMYGADTQVNIQNNGIDQVTVQIVTANSQHDQPHNITDATQHKGDNSIPTQLGSDQ